MTAWIVEPGSSGNNVDAPHKSSLDGIATSLLVVAYVAMDDWTPSVATTLFSVFDTAANGTFRANIATTGLMQLSLSVGGVQGTGATTTVLPTTAGIADGTGIWLFFTWRASNGSCDFRYSLDPPTTAPTAVTWTALQTARSSGVSGTLTTSTSLIRVGGYNTSGGTQPLAGKVYRALLYKGTGTGQITTASGQTLLVDCDPNQWTSGTTFVAGGDTYTIRGTASIAQDSVAKNDTDSGAGTEGTPSIAATLTGTDTGAGSEAQSIAATSSGTDTGAGTEALPKIAFTATDSGAGTESFSIIVPVSASDSGAGTDLGSSVQAALSASETAAGADTGSVRAALSASEAGAGSDLASPVHAALSGTDSGTDVENGSPFTGGNTTPSSSDQGVGTDAGQVTYKELSAADSGTSLEIRHPLQVRRKKLTLLQAAMGMADVGDEARRNRSGV